MLCCWCNKSLPPIKGYAILKATSGNECDHCSCFLCLSKRLATVPPTEWISCPTCKASISSHTIGPNLTKIVSHRDPVRRDVYMNPSKIKDPMRYFMKHDDNPGGKTLLYFAHVSANGNSGKIDTAIIEKNGEFQNEDLRETVISWARSLGRALYGKERGAEETLDRDKDDFESLIDYAIKKCRNPGFRFLYNFANSEPLDESVRSKIEAPSPRVSNLLACFAAHNILQQIDSNAGKKSGSRNVSILQRAVGGLLHAFNCSKKLIDLLSQFLISASMSYLHKQASKTHVKYLEGIRLPNLWDMIVYCNDNKDFLKNKDEKMDNWVVQTVKHVDKDDPVLAPCYEGKLCTVKKNLDCILDDCEDEGKDPYAAGIFGIRDIDYQRLTFYKLGHMEYCISHPFCHVKDLCPLIRQDNPNLKRKVPPLRNLGIDVRAHCQRSKTEQGCDL